MNNQMEFVTYTMVDEEKEGNNLLNSVNMKYNSSTSEAPDRTAMTTAVVLYKEPSSLKRQTTKKKVRKEKKILTLDALQQAVKTAQEKLEECEEREKGKVQKQLVKAKNAYKKKLLQTSLLMPVEIWTYEEDEKRCFLKKEIKEVMIAQNPSFCSQTKIWQQAKEIFNDPNFEKDSPKYMTHAQIFFDANIELADPNGNLIEKGTQNTLIPVCSVKEQVMIQAIYNLNIEAMVEGRELIPVTNVQVKSFDSLQECAQYEGTNLSLDRGLKGKEKVELSCLATQNEFMLKVQQVSREYNMPASTAVKYYLFGKKLTSSQWNDATRGMLPLQFQYDLNVGDKIIQTLLNIGLDTRDIKKRYFVDAFTKYQNVISSQTHQRNGLEKAMKILETLTPEDAEFLKELTDNQVENILILLQSKSENQ